jgi:hypothetical protein
MCCISMAARRGRCPVGGVAGLLAELALNGPAWRTPASMVVERGEDFVARVAALGLEGVVAKRLGSTYVPGRRCTSWVKHKLRRQERLTDCRTGRSAMPSSNASWAADPVAT